MLINGVIYLGSVILYNCFINTFFIDSDSKPFLIIKLLMSIVYQVWLFIIYLGSMTLSTIWA